MVLGLIQCISSLRHQKLELKTAFPDTSIHFLSFIHSLTAASICPASSFIILILNHPESDETASEVDSLD